jgi:hypothetical protein
MTIVGIDVFPALLQILSEIRLYSTAYCLTKGSSVPELKSNPGTANSRELKVIISGGFQETSMLLKTAP